jgi:hypothetical protein
VSQSHSQCGSVANPDKIIQINVESYNVYSVEGIIAPSTSGVQCQKQAKVTSGRDDDFNVKSGSMNDHFDDDTHRQNKKGSNKILDMQSLDLFYDSGTGSANTSISGSSSLSSPTVSDSSVINNSVEW